MSAMESPVVFCSCVRKAASRACLTPRPEERPESPFALRLPPALLDAVGIGTAPERGAG